MPNGLTITDRQIESLKPDDAFIQLAINESDPISLTFNNMKDKTIGIYIESTNCIAHSSFNIICNNTENILIQRQFKVIKDSLINQYTTIKIENNSSLTISDTNNNNEGHVLDYIDAKLEKEAKFYSLNQSYLSNNSRFQNRIYINGEESDATLHGLAINEAEQCCYYNTHIYHDSVYLLLTISSSSSSSSSFITLFFLCCMNSFNHSFMT